MGGLEGRLGEEDSVVGDDAHALAVDLGEAGDHRGAVLRLELVEARPVDDPRDHVANVEGLPRVDGDDPAELLGGVERLVHRRRALGGRGRVRAVRLAGERGAVKVGDNRARDGERVRVVVRVVVDHAALLAVHVGAAEVLGAHHLARGGLDQRRAAQEDGAVPLDDHRLVRHGRHVRAARGARAHHDRDLRDAHGRHVRLVVKNAAKVVAVGEDLILARQEGAARVD
mmetsp:Transcript_15820/g.36889  ORF Transcript_15820/g.36889 Transcript_15820/m.36889 type:complete len:228 (-) Transcript_15820:673-1356(-)